MAEVVSMPRLLYVPSPKSNSIDVRSPSTDFGMVIFRLAGDFQTTRVPRAVHIQSTNGDLKISPSQIAVDWQDGNTYRSQAGTITMIWVPWDCMWARRALDMDAIVKQNN